MQVNKTFPNNNHLYEVTKNDICNGRDCQETFKTIVEEPIGKFRTIRLYLCYNCAKKF